MSVTSSKLQQFLTEESTYRPEEAPASDITDVGVVIQLLM